MPYTGIKFLIYPVQMPFMKRNAILIEAGFVVTILFSCNNASNDGENVADGAKPDSVNNVENITLNAVPLTKDDSTFIMETALGGMMEVESGNLASQNAAHPRVKNFGSMMVADHTRANEELKNLAISRGMEIPSSLPPNLQAHMEEMKKMKGRSFDNHYISMMEDDHRKTIDKFEKQASSGGDEQLRSWAGATLPVLKKHLDSVQAIKKSM